MNALQSTLLHALELALVIIAAYIIAGLFNINSEDMKAIVTVVLAAFVKFARSSDSIPLKDYVNKP